MTHATPAIDDTRTRITRFLSASALAPADAPVDALAGDASDRRYFRVRRPDGPSIVLAVHPGPIETARMPFINVARLFAAMPVPVPRVIAHDDALGILALDDLGDVTLQHLLDAVTAHGRLDLYLEAVHLIGVMQTRGAELSSPDFAPYALAFDVEKLTFELEFFTQHFLEGHCEVRLTSAARTALSAEWHVIAAELAAEPRVLCHRDYHSRNLMWRDGRLHVIDFQDARLGPDTYDLASLLRDSYVSLSDDVFDTLLAAFLARPGAPAGTDARGFRRRFDLMAVQRNLKALGTFGFQASVRRNPSYLQHVPRTLGYVRDNLERYDRFSALRSLLQPILREA